MSTVILDDSIEHGTPEGYYAGCKGAGCPAGREHGFSCTRAYSASVGDFRYARLRRQGLTPADMAEALTIGRTTSTPTPTLTSAPAPVGPSTDTESDRNVAEPEVEVEAAPPRPSTPTEPAPTQVRPEWATVTATLDPEQLLKELIAAEEARDLYARALIIAIDRHAGAIEQLDTHRALVLSLETRNTRLLAECRALTDALRTKNTTTRARRGGWRAMFTGRS
ncbi:hypothetical protein [Microbacterium excoecariae]|uniref:hypothetical protein n=1 Tax=Microbacterium excoecariae TaxID=2715210 RepID=UPI0014099DAA|nr:hypothetical protein [Microbacterium excoecariae]NHI16841.1 hypothetical protein [Microbacterium excoecariae]